MRNWSLWINFCVSLCMIGVVGPSFPKLPQYLSTWETGITQPTEALGTRVRSHLMWNKKLKTLDYFSCVPACDLGYTWVQFPQIVPLFKHLWNRFSSTHRGKWHYGKVSFDVKQGAEDFALLFRCPGTWFGIFGPSFLKLPQYSSTCETGIARPTEPMTLE